MMILRTHDSVAGIGKRHRKGIQAIERSSFWLALLKLNRSAYAAHA